MIEINLLNAPSKLGTTAWLITGEKLPDKSALGLDKHEYEILVKQRDLKRNICCIFSKEKVQHFVFLTLVKEGYKNFEAARKAGASLSFEIKKSGLSELTLTTNNGDSSILLSFAEGLSLAQYSFQKYKKEKDGGSIKKLFLSHSKLNKLEVQHLNTIVEATWISRDLVNEPVIFLTAEKLAEAARDLGKKSGFETEILNKAKIKALKMGGILGVNAGSKLPPTFSTLTYKPKGAKNIKPIILVGKGVVYDTGGLSLKPTPNSMDSMKSDMAGAAAVIGTLYALSKNKLPLFVIGLIPATDNRPGEDAITPGDVITIHDGTTIEVLNTDAEGRLILADALSYAKKFDPELVIDLATLTGSAVRAIGTLASALMGTATKSVKEELIESGYETYERLIEFPLWDEYGDQIKSDIADLKNVGGANAGAITAGKFLQHFTTYPWIHLDIAGPSFLNSQDSYRPKNGTGVGVRLLYNFLSKRVKNK